MRSLSLLLLALAAACANAELGSASMPVSLPRRPAPATVEPVDRSQLIDMSRSPLAAAFAGEDLKLPEQRFTSLDERFSGAIYSARPVHARRASGSGLAELEADLPAGHTMTCVISARVSPARDLARVVSGLKMNLTVSGAQVAAYEAVDGHALLVVEIFYRGKGLPGVGDYQVAYLEGLGGPSFTCTHSGTSYRATFLRSVRKLAGTLRDAQAPPREPREGAVYSTSIDGHLVGGQYTERSAGREAGTLQLARGSLALSFDAQKHAVVATESREVAQTDASGAVLEEDADLLDVQIHSELKLRRSAEGYLVSGSVDQKAFEATLPPAPPLRMPGAAEMHGLAEGRTTELLGAAWDPAAPGEVRHHALRLNADGTLTDTRDGPGLSPLLIRVDARGELQSSTETEHGHTISVNRIWHDALCATP